MHSLSRQGTSLRPGILGTLGREPVAMTIFFPVTVLVEPLQSLTSKV